MPPRHGKSTHVSVYFPAWHLGLYPDQRIIACSYSADLSHTFSRQARNIIRSPEYAEIFGNTGVYEEVVELAPDSRSVAKWDLAAPHRGGYVSAGVGGSITGQGADILIIDDPLKDAEEAGSSTILQNVWEWFTTTAYTRLQGHDALILMMTRWSEDDLIGRVLAQAETNGSTDEWTILNLPALAEEDDPLGRREGEALWPERFPAERILRAQSVLSPREFSALYQQRPAPAEGNIFKSAWWRDYDPALGYPRFRRVIQCWDTAFKDKQENDYSACVTFGMAERERDSDSDVKERIFDLYLIDVYKEKLNFPQLLEQMRVQYDRWASRFSISEVVVEDKASGTSAYQSLRHNSNLPVVSVVPEHDKVARANAITAWYRLGRVFHPIGASWRASYQHELEVFPGGKNDDLVDATTMAVLRLMGPAGATAFLQHMRNSASNPREKKKNNWELPEGAQITTLM